MYSIAVFTTYEIKYWGKYNKSTDYDLLIKAVQRVALFSTPALMLFTLVSTVVTVIALHRFYKTIGGHMRDESLQINRRNFVLHTLLLIAKMLLIFWSSFSLMINPTTKDFVVVSLILPLVELLI